MGGLIQSIKGLNRTKAWPLPSRRASVLGLDLHQLILGPHPAWSRLTSLHHHMSQFLKINLFLFLFIFTLDWFCFSGEQWLVHFPPPTLLSFHHAQPKATTLSLQIFLFLTLIWLESYRMSSLVTDFFYLMFSRFIYIVACLSTLFLFVQNNITLYK